MIIAPLDCSQQRLLATQRGAAAAGQQPESIVKTRADLLHGKHLHARCRQFDGEGNAIQPPADFRYGRRRRRVERELRCGQSRTLDKKSNSLTRSQSGKVVLRAHRGNSERAHGDASLAGNAQPFTARDQYM